MPRLAGRRTVAVLAAAALSLVVGLAAPAGADDLEVTGEWTATGQLLSDPGCPLFHQIVDGTGEWTSLGAVTLHLDFCLADLGAADYPAEGTFSLTTATGTLTGALTGTVKASTQEPEGYPLHLELVTTGATGDLTGATGTLVLDGWFGPAAFTAFGTVSGTVTVPSAATPASTDDCLHGGWRDLADDQGQPFRNQGQCVAWVTTHT